MDITNIPSPRVDIIDKRTGLMSREWYLFFLNLFNLTGSGSNNNTLMDLQQGPPYTTSDDLSIRATPEQGSQQLVDTLYQQFLFEVKQQLDSQPSPQFEDILSLRQLVETAPPDYPHQPNTSSLIQPAPVSVGASPFIYTNNEVYDVDVITLSGMISIIEFSRDSATWYNTGLMAGMFNLSRGDHLRVTYTVAPTMTMIPR